MKAQQSILDQAQQGNASAIGQLMQAPLRAKGITVNTHLKNGFLQVNLVAEACPPKAASLSFIKNGIIHLNPQGVRLVRVDAYQTGYSTPGWVALLEERDLKDPSDNSVANNALQKLRSDRLNAGPAPGMGKKLFIALGLAGLLLVGAWAAMALTRGSEPAPQAEAVGEP